MENVIKIKYSSLYKVCGFALFVVAVLVLFNNFSKAGVSASSGEGIALEGNSAKVAGDAQVAKMRVVNGNYIIEPSEFKVGTNVRIEADISQLPGCSKSIVVPAFNIRKTLTERDNVIDFVPNKAGTFNIACSMNMYRGSFTILQPDGSKSNYVEQQQTGGHTCGAKGSGCGCGGF